MKNFLYKEIDLCKRLKSLNKKICIATNIFVKHLAGKSHDQIIQIKWKFKEIGIICGPYFILIKNIMVLILLTK